MQLRPSNLCTKHLPLLVCIVVVNLAKSCYAEFQFPPRWSCPIDNTLRKKRISNPRAAVNTTAFEGESRAHDLPSTVFAIMALSNYR
jgi:hypothetical protein